MIKRTILTVCVLLIIGALINVAVAWLCAWYVVPRHSGLYACAEFESGEPVVYRWHMLRSEGFGSTRITAGQTDQNVLKRPPLTQILPAWSRIEGIATARDVSAVGVMHPARGTLPAMPARPLGLVDDARGWPMRSLRSWWDCGLTTETLHETEMLHAGILLSPVDPSQGMTYALDEQRALPLQPIVIGFIADTVFYAAALTLPLVALFGTRELFRRLRGGCPKCGYPVGASPVCTECGAPIPARLRPQAGDAGLGA